VADGVHRPFQHERLTGVFFEESEIVVGEQVLDVVQSAGGAVVHHHHSVTFRQQPFAQVAAHEACATGDHHTHENLPFQPP
jgi:hypothetical protein